MKVLIGIILWFTACFSVIAYADEMYIHTFSYHADRDENYNEENFGLGYKHYLIDGNKNVSSHFGFFKNSEHRTSPYAGFSIEGNGEVKIGINIGIIGGYHYGNKESVIPYIVPSIKYKAMNLIIAPYPKAVIHATFDILEF